MRPKSNLKTYLKLLLAAFFWGGTFIAGKVIAGNMGPFTAAFLRFFSASIVLLYVCRKIEGKLTFPSKNQLVPVLLLGLTGVFLYNFCFFTGLKYIQAGRASVIVANNPIFIAILSAYFFKEKLTSLKITGIVISILGAVIVITKGNLLGLFHNTLGKGELYIFGTVASWVAYSLIGKALLKNLSPTLTVTYSVIAGTILLFVPATYEGLFTAIPALTLTQIISIIYLGIFGTVIAFIFYYRGIVEIGPTKAGLFINFVPISGVILSFLILRENITYSLLFGVILVSSGIYLTNMQK